MSTYTLNAELAKKSEGASYISRTGKYIGRFIKAEDTVSKKGTRGIDFTFESNNKEKANYLTIWTFDKDGKQLYGLNIINAIMMCLKVKEMNAIDFMVKEGQNEKLAKCFVELQNKPIGLLLAKEGYVKNDGTPGSKMVIEGVFEAETELTASEILERKTIPTRLAEMVARLKDRPLQTQTPRSFGGSNQNPTSIEDIDDAIPF